MKNNFLSRQQSHFQKNQTFQVKNLLISADNWK